MIGQVPVGQTVVDAKSIAWVVQWQEKRVRSNMLIVPSWRIRIPFGDEDLAGPAGAPAGDRLRGSIFCQPKCLALLLDSEPGDPGSSSIPPAALPRTAPSGSLLGTFFGNSTS
jgi:hypothetical protein